MTSSAQLPINNQHRDISLGRWVMSAIVLFLVFFIGFLQVLGFFAPGVPSANVSKAIVLASAIGATVIPLLREIRPLNVPFLARLWRVMRFVILIESISLLVSIVWSHGDGPKSLAFLVHKLWFAHALVFFYVLTHLDYLLTGDAPEYGDSDDEDWHMQNDDNGVNVDGSAMFGGVDTHGNAYGATSSRSDDD